MAKQLFRMRIDRDELQRLTCSGLQVVPALSASASTVAINPSSSPLASDENDLQECTKCYQLSLQSQPLFGGLLDMKLECYVKEKRRIKLLSLKLFSPGYYLNIRLSFQPQLELQLQNRDPITTVVSTLELRPESKSGKPYYKEKTIYLHKTISKTFKYHLKNPKIPETYSLEIKLLPLISTVQKKGKEFKAAVVEKAEQEEKRISEEAISSAASQSLDPMVGIHIYGNTMNHCVLALQQAEVKMQDWRSDVKQQPIHPSGGTAADSSLPPPAPLADVIYGLTVTHLATTVTFGLVIISLVFLLVKAQK